MESGLAPAAGTRRLRLRPGPDGLAHARTALAGMENEVEPGLFFDISLCVNELVTNAIRAVEHDQPGSVGPDDDQTVELELSVAGGTLYAAVKDHGAGARRLERVIVGSGHDFGLYIISRLAHRWGVDHVDNRVWLEFGIDDHRLPRTSAFQPDRAGP
jgi:two-component sensor histidine kinase